MKKKKKIHKYIVLLRNVSNYLNSIEIHFYLNWEVSDACALCKYYVDTKYAQKWRCQMKILFICVSYFCFICLFLHSRSLILCNHTYYILCVNSCDLLCCTFNSCVIFLINMYCNQGSTNKKSSSQQKCWVTSKKKIYQSPPL